MTRRRRNNLIALVVFAAIAIALLFAGGQVQPVFHGVPWASPS